MSNWTNVGWPAGIRFSRPRDAINLIIQAINALTPYVTTISVAPLSGIPALTKKSSIASLLGPIDDRLRMCIGGYRTQVKGPSLTWNVNTDSNLFPQWMMDAAADSAGFPIVPGTGSGLTHARFLYRWVISRYKVICQTHRYLIASNGSEGFGSATYGTLAGHTPDDYANLIDDWIANPAETGLSPSTIRLWGYWASNWEAPPPDSYFVREALNARWKVFSGTWSPGTCCFGCVGEVYEDLNMPSYEFDPAPLGPAGTILYSPLTAPMTAAQAAGTVLGVIAAFPASWKQDIPTSITSIKKKMITINSITVADISHTYPWHDPEAVWQGITA